MNANIICVIYVRACCITIICAIYYNSKIMVCTVYITTFTVHMYSICSGFEIISPRMLPRDDRDLLGLIYKYYIYITNSDMIHPIPIIQSH